MTQHKWHKEIKAWADGAEIEYKYVGLDPFFIDRNNEWKKIAFPIWTDEYWEFRIKPQPKEPQYLYVSQAHDGKPDISFLDHQGCIGKIKLEVDDVGTT
jgi:hypothetical protein